MRVRVSGVRSGRERRKYFTTGNDSGFFRGIVFMTFPVHAPERENGETLLPLINDVTAAGHWHWRRRKLRAFPGNWRCYDGRHPILQMY